MSILTWRWIGRRLFDVTVRDDDSVTFAQVFDRRPTMTDAASVGGGLPGSWDAP